MEKRKDKEGNGEGKLNGSRSRGKREKKEWDREVI